MPIEWINVFRLQVVQLADARLIVGFWPPIGLDKVFRHIENSILSGEGINSHAHMLRTNLFGHICGMFCKASGCQLTNPKRTFNPVDANPPPVCALPSMSESGMFLG